MSMLQCYNKDDNKEVNIRLTGWAHPVNLTCPLPQISHPVNYLAHIKMGTTIIKYREFRPNFCKID